MPRKPNTTKDEWTPEKKLVLWKVARKLFDQKMELLKRCKMEPFIWEDETQSYRDIYFEMAELAAETLMDEANKGNF